MRGFRKKLNKGLQRYKNNSVYEEIGLKSQVKKTQVGRSLDTTVLGGGGSKNASTGEGEQVDGL